MADRFSFRWGIPILDNLPFTQLYHFLLDNYATLGMTPAEMMFIVHLSQFRREGGEGECRPSLATIAEKMGYTDDQPVRRLKRRLLARGLLRVTARPGQPDLYDVAPFAQAAFACWQAQQAPVVCDTPVISNTPVKNDTPVSNNPPTPVKTDRGGVLNQIPEEEITTRGIQEKGGMGAQAPENPPPVPVLQAPENPSLVATNGRAPATPDPAFDEITSARLRRQTALAERAAAAVVPSPFTPCPAWADLTADERAALAEMLAPYSEEPEPIARRQVAWFRQEHKRDRRLRAEWWAALQTVIQDEVDKRLPVGPPRASPKKAAAVIPIVANWD